MILLKSIMSIKQVKKYEPNKVYCMNINDTKLYIVRKIKKRGPVRAKKVSFDGINFASGLEKYMYIALQKNKIKAEYEGKTYE